MNKNKCKTEILTNLWYSLGGQENGVCAENLLRSLNGEREFCVHGSLRSKHHRVHVAEVGAKLVNHLGECYRAPADEPEFAAAVMQKLSGVGANLLTERRPQLRYGAIARAGRRVYYSLAAVPMLASDGTSPAWLGIADWSRRPISENRPEANL
jgi:hypothetical protein